jgi:hypothetical protein
MKNKMHLALGINARFTQTNLCTNTNIIKYIDLVLYGYEDDGLFIRWLLEIFYENGKVAIHFIETIELLDLDDDYLHLTTLVDDISVEDVYGLEIHGAQIRIQTPS